MDHHSLRRKLRVLFSAMTLLALILPFTSQGATELTPAQQLAGALQAARQTLTLSNSRLGGAAAATIIEHARSAQFVLIGEDHGFAELPQFVMALDQALGNDGFPNLVLEIGPFAAERLSQAVRAGQLTALIRAHPGAMPFFEWTEAAALAQHWSEQAGERTALWGIDQEFLLSAVPNLERLFQLASNARGRTLAKEYLERARDAQRSTLEKHDPSAVLMLTLSDADFALLRAALSPLPGSEVDRLLRELSASTTIYRENDSDPRASNRHRSQLMKRLFMTQYQAAVVAAAKPARAMFLMGAYHSGRGLSPTHQFDIGNMASELAESYGCESFHILVIAASGTVNRKLAFMADDALRQAPYAGKEELASLGALPFLEHAYADSWTYFPLEALRRQGTAREAGGPTFSNLAYAYDAVVVINHATAAHDVLVP